MALAAQWKKLRVAFFEFYCFYSTESSIFGFDGHRRIGLVFFYYYFYYYYLIGLDAGVATPTTQWRRRRRRRGQRVDRRRPT